MKVVNERLQVYGIQGLRVVDASGNQQTILKQKSLIN